MFTATEAVPVAKVVAGNKRYPGVVALDNVNFTLNKGEVRALLGKNGAGKSTLIRMLTGSERPDSGDIWIGETRLEGDEATLTRRAAELGVRAVYQELSLVEGLTVAENLCLGQWPRRNGMIDYLQMAQDAQRCLQALGVDVSPEQLVSTLSPAQKQLVEIARVMKGEPRVVILDEPTSSLASAEVELVRGEKDVGTGRGGDLCQPPDGRNPPHCLLCHRYARWSGGGRCDARKHLHASYCVANARARSR